MATTSKESKYHILYVDDEVDAPERTAKRISKAPSLTCELVAPPILDLKSLEIFLGKETDLYLIDQDLGKERGYLGSSLVGHIRSKHPDVPIVLISRSFILRQRLKGRVARGFERLHMVDDLVTKGDVNDHLEEMQGVLETLADGYARLRKMRPKGIDLRAVVGATEEEFDELREASPPVADEGDLPFMIAEWIRNTLLAYPGPLLSPLHSAVLLGISPEAFREERVRERFGSARYEGLFSPPEGRWWKRRLLRTAGSICTEAGRDGPVRDNLRFALGPVGSPLPPPRCVWDGSEGANAICAVLHRPVKTAHSLRYYPDQRPSVMDEARISFRAIQTHDEYDEDLLDSSGRLLVRDIEELDIPANPYPDAP